ncbi:MAG: hydantoinase/oxoprolinase family protein [Rhodospirillaceae bacterium]|jgi:N-methylhydantoinase A|nr:hydantoinase/oxoprolinase family protein [Rhodospirillaceae bacterium]
MRIGVDIGGTFTDLVCIDDTGALHTAKTPSTPDDPSRGVMEGLTLLAERVGMSLSDMLAATNLFIHGSTVATNLVVERKGATLGLITTSGFRDIIELRDGSKQNRYNIRMAPPEPLIPRPRRREAMERVNTSGDIEIPLDEDAVRDAIIALRDAGVEGLVVLFMHSHRNGAHENRVRELVAESGWAPFVSLSHEVLRREGEYDRVSTAAVNAYVGPGLGGYLNRLAANLAENGLAAPVLVMQSTGGVLPLDHAVQHAVGSVTSGPAGGAMAGALFARLRDEPHLVTYDMGGTSTDICLIEDGAPLERQATQLGEVKIAVPALDISALGAGGGSIAWIDSGGILDLGPHSAGAAPGPACYGQGGESPTLTDANLVLGLIAAETFLGGRLSLDRDLAAVAVETHVAKPLGLSVEDAAFAINALASARIAEGIRANTVRRGLDPREFTIFSFGGAGGLHAAAVAEELEIPRAVIPREASVLSAVGFLAADVRHDYQRVVGHRLPELTTALLRERYAELDAEAIKALGAEGFAPDAVRFTRVLDCRYFRQVYTVPVEITDADLARDDNMDWFADAFETVYSALYRHVHERDAIVVDSCRLVAHGELTSLSLPKGEPTGGDIATAQRGSRRVYLGAWIDAPCYWFDDLTPGMRLNGPAMIDSESTTVTLPDGVAADIDPYGSLVVTRTGDQS